MKKIIFFLFLLMFTSISAKHYKKNDNNPNATVLVKLNFPGEKNRGKKSNTGFWKIDDNKLNKGIVFHTAYFDSMKIEPGIHTLYIYHEAGAKYAKVDVKYDFEENKTYLIDIFIDKSTISTKVREEV